MLVAKSTSSWFIFITFTDVTSSVAAATAFPAGAVSVPTVPAATASAAAATVGMSLSLRTSEFSFPLISQASPCPHSALMLKSSASQ